MEVDPVAPDRAASRSGPDQFEGERVAARFGSTRDGDVVAVAAHGKAEGDGATGTILAGGRAGRSLAEGPGWKRRAEAG